MKRILLISIFVVMIVAAGVYIKDNIRSDTLDNSKNSILVSGSEKDMKDKRKRLPQMNGIKKLPFDINSVETSLVRSESTDGINFTYEVRNKGEKDISFVFPSSQSYEYEIYTKTGELVYRYSDDKVFTQAIKEKLLPAGKSLSYTVTLPTLESGEYSLIIWLVARGMNYFKEKQSFKVD